ncbi:hypothetical protein PPL_10329 [Heterostelium album PN500]|uniref:riboflavin kinase n=1 Tax=Heterostelium pallidum (strain ATCC 26659 / Pp 5 / PN500) TaxID=670386 RepID=D3BQ09_HETP5|nr:hypothetical protein PPL_10329 [Heterostelium album PN500]EFA76560.1 hypothetical protein PPL_10329 [Heterostelium album PN500]|eukprot:XP_020428692.1 hypothetical protein PPL_10329 [Heterostelium album PN500]
MEEIQRGVSKEDLSMLPLFLRGKVIKGFGRGSKDLGCPTANLPTESYEATIKDIPIGVFFGWANVKGIDSESVIHKMVMSVGWNPFYKNEKKTLEIHILNRYDRDFYGEQVNAIATGFIRPMCDFKSLEGLIKAINDDISYASEQLDTAEQQLFKSHQFFSHCCNESSTPPSQEAIDSTENENNSNHRDVLSFKLN